MKKAQLAKEAQVEEGEYEAAVRSEETPHDTTYQTLLALSRVKRVPRHCTWRTGRCLHKIPVSGMFRFLRVAWRSAVVTASSAICVSLLNMDCMKNIHELMEILHIQSVSKGGAARLQGCCQATFVRQLPEGHMFDT